MNHVGTSPDLPGTGHLPGTCMHVTHLTFVATEGNPWRQSYPAGDTQYVACSHPTARQWWNQELTPSWAASRLLGACGPRHSALGTITLESAPLALF